MSITLLEPLNPYLSYQRHISFPLSYHYTLTLPSSGVPPTFIPSYPYLFYYFIYNICRERKRVKSSASSGMRTLGRTRISYPLGEYHQAHRTRAGSPYSHEYPLYSTHGRIYSLKSINFIWRENYDFRLYGLISITIFAPIVWCL